MIKYYCYISKSKVDELYMQTKEGNIEENDVIKKIDVDISAATDKEKLSLLSILGADIGFGASGALQFNKKEKMQYATKLNKVITELENNNQIDTFSMDKILGSHNSRFYYIKTNFHVSDDFFMEKDNSFAEGIVELISDPINEDGVTISLACSFKYFSDTRGDGKYIVQSCNYYFFKNKLKLDFDVLFVFLGYDKPNKRIYGSPIFIAMDDIKRIRL